MKLSASLGALTLIVGTSVALSAVGTAHSYTTQGLLVYLDADNPSSYNGTTTWNDLSSNNIDGTIVGAVTYDGTTQSLQFPGGANGTAYVALNTVNDPFRDFSTGMTLEFEAEFGSTRAAWERVFDFALGTDSTPSNVNDAFWVGQYGNTNELALEIWDSGVQQGYCRTSTSGTALGTAGSRAFAKWVVTLGDDSGTIRCRIYKDGVELSTVIDKPYLTSITSPTLGGSTYVLPRTTTRPSAFFGRSNFLADNDFEGSLRYVRIYSQALTQDQVNDNITNDEPSDLSTAPGRSSKSESCGPGIFLTVPSESNAHSRREEIVFGACSLSPRSPYTLSITPRGGATSQGIVLSSGVTNGSGALEDSVVLPFLRQGNYSIVLSASHPRGFPLQLTNLISLDANGVYSSTSDEALQPHLR